MVEARRVEAVLVAGDVYDRALPGLEAVALFDDVLHRLADLGVPTVFISGNHDSARRLGVGAGLIERAGIHLRTDPDGCAAPVLLADEHGPVAVYGLPYLEPALTRERFGLEAGGHTEVLRAAMARVTADLAERPAGTRAVVLAHAFVTGGEPSDSERDITVGGVASVPASVFDGVHYAALGHLHGCQTLAPHLRYSGSPLAYSFSETDHRKTMWLVDLAADGSVEAERIDCPQPRPLARIRGRLAELLADERLAVHEQAWVQATLTDPVRPANPMEELRRRFPHTLQLLFEPEPTPGEERVSYADRVSGRADSEIAEGFVRHVRGGGPDELEQGWLREAFEAVRLADERARELPR
ncbi:exonuclease SbcCD subunit D [Kitasatospora cystarginea]|uniref:Nuclease SbcCD subunit D n=1 Tax=Kitasatospora cystarginea TaxID=58350 RepID=A0ABN3E341_9ACTN